VSHRRPPKAPESPRKPKEPRRGLAIGEYLAHILEGVERIERYTRGCSREAFLGSDLIQDGVIRNLEVIGEASGNLLKLYPEFARLHPEIQLSSAYQMRKALIHGYTTVDVNLGWQTVFTSIPALKRQLKALEQGRNATRDAQDLG